MFLIICDVLRFFEAGKGVSNTAALHLLTRKKRRFFLSGGNRFLYRVVPLVYQYIRNQTKYRRKERKE